MGTRTDPSFSSAHDLVSIDVMPLTVVASHHLCTIIASNAKKRKSKMQKSVFDERDLAPPNCEAVKPDVINVAAFFGLAVERAQFNQDVVVGALILFDRFVSALPRHDLAWSWRLLLLLSMCIVQKLIDDEALGSDQFAELWDDATATSSLAYKITAKQVAGLETELLKVMRFEVYIASKDWHKINARLRALWLRKYHSTPFSLALRNDDVKRTFQRREAKERATG